MNKKLTVRLLLDACMVVVMLLLMAPLLTGLTLHEILGTAVLVLFSVHCCINLWWFRSFHKQHGAAMKIKFVVNILLLISSVVLLTSSVFISKSVFAFLGLSGGQVWNWLHRVSAYSTFILISVHLGLHWNIILGAFRSALKVRHENPVFTVAARLCSLVLAAFGIWASINRDIAGKYAFPAQEAKSDGKAETASASLSSTTDYTTLTAKADNTAAVYENLHGQNGGQTEERSFSDTPVESGESEQDFLGRLYCTGCGKHCPLTSPQCGRGSTQAQQASAFWQSQTGTSSVSSSAESSSSQSETSSSEITGESEESGSLQQYLGGLTCTGCGKSCPLSAPQCGVGKQQAETTAASYQSGTSSKSESSSSSSSSAAETPSSGESSEEEQTKSSESTDDSFPAVFRDFGSIMGMYAAGSYYILSFVQRRKEN